MTSSGEAPRDSQTIGELEVRGPWVARQYYNAPETKDRWTGDGWFRTGDVATMAADGSINYTQAKVANYSSVYTSCRASGDPIPYDVRWNVKDVRTNNSAACGYWADCIA